MHPLGELTTFETKDGSLSIHSKLFNEAFHSNIGARTEAQQKFINTAEIKRFKKVDKIFILDVCFGIGYNSACLFESLRDNQLPNFEWWGLEIDRRPLEIGNRNPKYFYNWSSEVKELLKAVERFNGWKHERNKGKILWGDARQQINSLPNNMFFDLIMLDAFSPKQCPELWSEEFLLRLSNKLSSGGRLITYCRAAAIRGSLKRAGLILGSILPSKGNETSWSAGTLGINSMKNCNSTKSGKSWRSLSPMEEEHLLTKAAIPYRDPSGIGTKELILARRRAEQENCGLETTSKWKKRWDQANLFSSQ